MIESEFGKLLLENWQIVFIYGLKIARDIQLELTRMRVEIDIIKEQVL